MCTKKVYPEKNKNACQNGVAEIWKIMKKFGVRSKLYISIVWHCSVLCFLVSLCCSFKKIKMFSFQYHSYVWIIWIIMNFFANFGRVNSISISKIAVKSHKLCVKISFWYIPEIIDKRNKQIFSQWSRRGGEGQASFSGNSWGFPQLPHLGKYCKLSPPNMT